MKLYFTCPTVNASFASDNYALLQGYCVVDKGTGDKELQGKVNLNAACPLCGQKHQYNVKDVLCPLTGEKNER